jgi:hypothetical protein
MDLKFDKKSMIPTDFSSQRPINPPRKDQKQVHWIDRRAQKIPSKTSKPHELGLTNDRPDPMKTKEPHKPDTT